MKKIMILIAALGIGAAMAQEKIMLDDLKDSVDQPILPDTVPVTDGFYKVNSMENVVPFAYPEVNTKNIRFYKRVWRDIDLKDAQNMVLAMPGNSLIEVIMKAIKNEKLSLYSPDDDTFKHRMSAHDGVARLADSVLVPIFDEEGNQIDSRMTLNEFDPAKVTKFRIKEDIFFDKQRGRLENRIIGVAPLMTITTSADLAESIGSTPAFWLYFPQLRYSLVQTDISDPDRELYEMTMDDFFVQGKYASTIVRESSPGMLQYDTSGKPLDGKKIEERLEDYKKKLWSNPKGVKDPEPDNNLADKQNGKIKKKK
ncbi:gliding motility protein GldN [Olivibacter sp. CPCC 100613]|uniref:type IX secretion system ring protein PorN/GldN n=1 Tax=Olivibacter sp. CPCC 100613 TaxID=3079931 RepID=UPI002FF7D301